MLTKIVNGAIPQEKKHKVSILSGSDIVAGTLLDLFEPNQLEKNYGGTAPDLAPADTYPFHFFPSAVKSLVPSTGKSLHESCPLAFHVGDLWDTSKKAQKAWLSRALAASLTSDSARTLSTLASSHVQPVCDATHWHEVCMQGNIIKKRKSVLLLQDKSFSAPSQSVLSSFLPLPRTQKQSLDILRRKSAM